MRDFVQPILRNSVRVVGTWLVVFAMVLTASAPGNAEVKRDSKAQQASDPRALIEERHQDIRTIITSTPDEAEMQDKIRATLDTFVDYDLFAELAGRSFWDDLSKAQQTEFVDLFKRLIQRTYLRRFKANSPFKLELRGETRFNTGRDKALVTSIIESDNVAADVIYKLYVPAAGASKSGWWAYDVEIDEVSIMRNYRTSFNRIWRQGGWTDLSERMRRRAETDTDSGKIGDLD
jgi:phospholipid transport system substrate-binding protein